MNEATFSLKQCFFGIFDFMIHSIEHKVAEGTGAELEKKVSIKVEDEEIVDKEKKFSIARIRKETKPNAEG
jgi:hypothetical protein